MSLHHNPLVDFLASYGPTAVSNNMYDEFVVAAAKKAGLKQIDIAQPLVNEAMSRLCADEPRSIIFTGTAGDGKTFTARKVLDRLSSGSASWGNEDTVVSFTVTNRIYRFVKDLSELNESQKDALFPEIMDALHGREGAPVFVICVNDGHLLRFFRERARLDERADAVHEALMILLRDDQSECGELQAWVKNMSRQPHDDVLDQIVDQIVGHPSWEACHGCPQKIDTQNPCPILVNRDILASTSPASIRARIKDMVRLAAADDRHLSVRQLLVLVVNTLLGDSHESGGAYPLLTCTKAVHRAKSGEYHFTNPFENLFGENLPARQRSQFPVFAALDAIGVGSETNNFFDGALLCFTDADLPDDPCYGESIFSQTRASYRENPKNGIDALRSGLVAQRRRIFCSMEPSEWNFDTLRNPWNLTVFRNGGHYLRFVAQLISTGRDDKAEAVLLKGLNRALSGAMTETRNALWLTEPSGVFRGRDIPLLVKDIRQRAPYGFRVAFEAPRAHGRPPTFALFGPDATDAPLAEIKIRPTLFEFLYRVADGALPTSFSNQCLQDIRRFQLAAAAQVASIDGEASAQEVSIIETGENELRVGRTIIVRETI